MDAMHRHTVTLEGPLAGISRVPKTPSVAAPPPSLPGANLLTPPLIAAPVAAPESQTLRNLLAELTRLIKEIQARDRRPLAEVAQMSVELAAAIAERLLNAAIAA